MTPTLIGRIESRIVLVLTAALPWTAIITPFLIAPAGMGLGDVFRLTLSGIAIVLVAGIGWELVYHALQQFRWDKDWPTLFGLVTGINEGVTTWVGLHLLNHLNSHYGVTGSYGSSNLVFKIFLVHFITTWVFVWLWSNGPFKVVFFRWRFEGGRVV